MRYLCLFSGVGAPTLAWQQLGWECAAFAQFDPEHDYESGPDFPSTVLAKHWPKVPNLGDITKITPAMIKKLGHIDLVVFGSPCQGLSIAGQLEGLNDERSGLFKPAVKIIKWCRKYCNTRFALWENVKGAFSSNGGSDFAEVLHLLSGAKFSNQKWETSGIAIGKEGLVEWVTLDAQYFGVPQRRRRVFALADFRDWPNRQQILFESESLPGDLKQSSEEKQNTTSETQTSIRTPSHRDDVNGVHPTLNQSHNTGGIALSGQELFSQRGCGLVSSIHQNTKGEVRLSDVSPTLAGQGGTVGQGYQAIACFDQVSFGEYGDGKLASTKKARDHKDANDLVVHGTQDPCVSDKAFTLGRNNGAENALLSDWVRKLTPIECERLQGMPDNHTQVSWSGKPMEGCPDGHRYKAIGNSMAVPVMKWIGQRIDAVVRQQANAA